MQLNPAVGSNADIAYCLLGVEQQINLIQALFDLI